MHLLVAVRRRAHSRDRQGQPDEGISLRICAKLPGQAIQIRPVQMDFQYGSSFGKRSPEAYERLLLDAMLGDPTLFARGDFVDLSWELVTPIIDAWRASLPKAPPAGPLPICR